MLNRRHARIKAMQAYFACTIRKTEESLPALQQAVNVSFNDAWKSYLFGLQACGKIIQYAHTDYSIDQNRNIAVETTDFRPISDDPVLVFLRSEEFTEYCNSYHVNCSITSDVIQSIFLKFKQSSVAKRYRNGELTDSSSLLKAYFKNFLFKNDEFQDLVTEAYPFWADVKDANLFSSVYLLKDLSENCDLDMVKRVRSNFDEILNFSHELIIELYKQHDEIEEMITPRLRNWDISRIATLDIILIKLALIEMRQYMEIPVRVTINEAVEISKKYSSPKSYEFINGILDVLGKRIRTIS